MTRSIHAPAGLFDSLQYGFAQVAVIATPHRGRTVGRVPAEGVADNLSS